MKESQSHNPKNATASRWLNIYKWGIIGAPARNYWTRSDSEETRWSYRISHSHRAGDQGFGSVVGDQRGVSIRAEW